jgi:hypothetical protein
MAFRMKGQDRSKESFVSVELRKNFVHPVVAQIGIARYDGRLLSVGFIRRPLDPDQRPVFALRRRGSRRSVAPEAPHRELLCRADLGKTDPRHDFEVEKLRAPVCRPEGEVVRMLDYAVWQRQRIDEGSRDAVAVADQGAGV